MSDAEMLQRLAAFVDTRRAFFQRLVEKIEAPPYQALISTLEWRQRKLGFSTEMDFSALPLVMTRATAMEYVQTALRDIDEFRAHLTEFLDCVLRRTQGPVCQTRLAYFIENISNIATQRQWKAYGLFQTAMFICRNHSTLLPRVAQNQPVPPTLHPIQPVAEYDSDDTIEYVPPPASAPRPPAPPQPRLPASDVIEISDDDDDATPVAAAPQNARAKLENGFKAAQKYVEVQAAFFAHLLRKIQACIPAVGSGIDPASLQLQTLYWFVHKPMESNDTSTMPATMSLKEALEFAETAIVDIATFKAGLNTFIDCVLNRRVNETCRNQATNGLQMIKDIIRNGTTQPKWKVYSLFHLSQLLMNGLQSNAFSYSTAPSAAVMSRPPPPPPPPPPTAMSRPPPPPPMSRPPPPPPMSRPHSVHKRPAPSWPPQEEGGNSSADTLSDDDRPAPASRKRVREPAPRDLTFDFDDDPKPIKRTQLKKSPKQLAVKGPAASVYTPSAFLQSVTTLPYSRSSKPVERLGLVPLPFLCNHRGCDFDTLNIEEWRAHTRIHKQ